MKALGVGALLGIAGRCHRCGGLGFAAEGPVHLCCPGDRLFGRNSLRQHVEPAETEVTAPQFLRLRFLAVAIWAVLATSCAAPPPPPAPAAAPAPAPLPGNAVNAQREPVAALLGSNQTAHSVDGTFGLLLLQHGDPRNLAVCEAFFAAFDTVRNPLAPESSAILRPTFWPDDRSAAQLPSRTTCSSLLTTYNWPLASTKLTSLGLAGARGPVLVAYSKTTDIAGIKLNLSEVRNDQWRRSFLVWKNMITDDPPSWSTTDWLITAREWVRPIVMNYSPAVLTFFKPTTAQAASDHTSAAGNPGDASSDDVELASKWHFSLVFPTAFHQEPRLALQWFAQSAVGVRAGLDPVPAALSAPPGLPR